MPAGTPYFAWIDANETTFTASHQRWDEQIFSFKLWQDEGDPASLTLVVRRPRDEYGNPIGLLGPGRKIWCWFALDCGPSLIKFRGRLVGVPTDIFQELVTLDFVARPVDVVAQKAALATTLKVLPFYDPVMIEESRRTDVEVVLEAYTSIWHFHPETHVITVSDEITGEDGTVSFDASNAANTVLYDGLSLTLTSGPLARATVTADFNWTQSIGAGIGATVDLTDYLLKNWPASRYPHAVLGSIQLDESNWPKPGVSLGGGWTVADSTAENLLNFDTRSETFESHVTTIFSDGDRVEGTTTVTDTKVVTPVNLIPVTTLTTNDKLTVNTQKNPDGGTYIANYSRNTTKNVIDVSIQEIMPTLIVTCASGTATGRQVEEKVIITLTADVQPILTDPAGGEVLIIDDIHSTNLSEPIESVIPIGDPVRSSYVTTERGNQSIQYLILLLRAHLMKRARVVEIAFAPKLERMPEITLRKNASLYEPRVGAALGKIIAYSIALDGSDGRIKCEVRIGCAVGRSGTVTTVAGTPVYCSITYVGNDYQQFTGQRQIITATGDSSINYEPPLAVVDPNSINFLSGNLTAADIIEVPLSVELGDIPPATEVPVVFPGAENAMETVTEFVKAYWLPQFETKATFKLKDVTADLTGDLASQYTIATSSLKIPLGINLEAT